MKDHPAFIVESFAPKADPNDKNSRNPLMGLTVIQVQQVVLSTEVIIVEDMRKVKMFPCPAGDQNLSGMDDDLKPTAPEIEEEAERKKSERA